MENVRNKYLKAIIVMDKFFTRTFTKYFFENTGEHLFLKNLWKSISIKN